jgi:hypothetical protein
MKALGVHCENGINGCCVCKIMRRWGGSKVLYKGGTPVPAKGRVKTGCKKLWPRQEFWQVNRDRACYNSECSEREVYLR